MRERERERKSTSQAACASRGGAEKDRDRIPSRIHTVNAEPDVGLELTNGEIMTRAEIKSLDASPTEPPRRPKATEFLAVCYNSCEQLRQKWDVSSSFFS